ncbi:hypothetical protein KKC91_11215 [bacterium]|nr:hypothetical protein [bacterium]
MIKFKKGYNFEIVSVIISILFLYSTVLYASPNTLRVPVGQDSTNDRIVGAMHIVDRTSRLEALRRLLRMKGIDIEVWAKEQEDNMTPEDRGALVKALEIIGLTETQIESIADKIILCEVPPKIRLEERGRNASRIGGLIVKTEEGHRILFPKDRVGDITKIEYLPDLLHEAVELDLIEQMGQMGQMGQKVDVAAAHERALETRANFLKRSKRDPVKVAQIGKPVVLSPVPAGAVVGAMHEELIVLRNGAQVSRRLVALTALTMKKLWKTKPMLAYKLIAKARDSKYDLNVELREMLITEGLLQFNGSMHEDTRAIIVSMAEGEGFDMQLVNPIASADADDKIVGAMHDAISTSVGSDLFLSAAGAEARSSITRSLTEKKKLDISVVKVIDLSLFVDEDGIFAIERFRDCIEALRTEAKENAVMLEDAMHIKLVDIKGISLPHDAELYLAELLVDGIASYISEKSLSNIGEGRVYSNISYYLLDEFKDADLTVAYRKENEGIFGRLERRMNYVAVEGHPDMASIMLGLFSNELIGTALLEDIDRRLQQEKIIVTRV